MITLTNSIKSYQNLVVVIEKLIIYIYTHTNIHTKLLEVCLCNEHYLLQVCYISIIQAQQNIYLENHPIYQSIIETLLYATRATFVVDFIMSV